MSKRKKTIAVFVIGGAVALLLAGILVSVFTGSRIKEKQNIHMGKVQEVGLALKAYADEHKGVMPADLNALRPYLPDKEVLEGVEFLTPGMKFTDLPLHAIILRRVYQDDKQAFIVHPDMSVEVHHL